MSIPTKDEHAAELDGPLTERTRAILAAIDRIDRKIDVITQERSTWRAAFVRALKQFISLVDPGGSKHKQ